MRAVVTPPDSSLAQVYGWLRYHLGWAERDGSPAEARRAKGIRPLVCLTACTAVGGRIERAQCAAAAIELTHEFSLIHDDLQDGDRLRRGRPALWTWIGVPQAINAGDLLFGLARRQLSAAELPAELKADLEARYDAACILLAEGQYLDISFELADSISIEDYIGMVERKTAALLAAAASMGAACGGGTQGACDALDHYGRALGVAFQIQDDILGVWGRSDRTGKPAGRDLIRKKRSLPIVTALADPTLGKVLADLWSPPEPDPAVAAAAAQAMFEAGIPAQSTAVAHLYAAQAEAALSGLDLEPTAKTALLALVRRAVERDR